MKRLSLSNMNFESWLGWWLQALGDDHIAQGTQFEVKTCDRSPQSVVLVWCRRLQDLPVRGTTKSTRKRSQLNYDSIFISRIYLNTTRGGTPATSPLESPDPPTFSHLLSGTTLESTPLRSQVRPLLKHMPHAVSCSPRHVLRQDTPSPRQNVKTRPPDGYQPLLTPESSDNEQDDQT